MGKCIVVSNQKGGVGKSTTTKIVAEILKEYGNKVLVIDFDPQGNLSFSVGVDSNNCVTIYEALKGIISVNKAIQRTDNLHVLAANALLSGIEAEFKGEGREFILSDVINSIKSEYDYIFIDTPPSLGILTINSFVASDFVLVPITPDIFSLQGVTEIFDSVNYIKKRFSLNVNFLGVFLNQYSYRSKIHKEIKSVCEMICDDLKIRMFDSCIRKSVSVCESQSLQVNIIKYRSNCTSLKDYFLLTDEILKVMNNDQK